MRSSLATMLMLSVPAQAGTLVVQAENLTSMDGEVRVAVCSGTLDEQGCKLGATRRPASASEEFVFEGLAPGRYAVAAYHDLNGNGELDRIPPGLPTEPYGFSNDVGRFAPPGFAAAAIDVGAERATVVVRLRPLIGGRRQETNG